MLVTLDGDTQFSARVVNLEEIGYAYYDGPNKRGVIKFKFDASLYVSKGQMNELISKVEALNNKKEEIGL